MSVPFRFLFFLGGEGSDAVVVGRYYRIRVLLGILSRRDPQSRRDGTIDPRTGSTRGFTGKRTKSVQNGHLLELNGMMRLIDAHSSIMVVVLLVFVTGLLPWNIIFRYG